MKDLVGQRAVSAFSILLDGADDVANLTEKSIVCGETAIDLESFQKTGKINKNILIKQSYPANSRLFAITMLGKIKINNGEYSDPDTLTPNYSQEPSINKKKE